MKKTILSLLLVCGVISISVSCAKEVDENTTDTSTSSSSTNSFTAKVNGNAFAVNYINSNLVDDILSFNAGHSINGNTVGVFMPVSITTGTYPTTQTGDIRITYTSSATTQNNLYSAKDNGTITITSHNTANKIIKGTFAADLTHTSAGAANDTIKITDGTFIIVY